MAIAMFIGAVLAAAHRAQPAEFVSVYDQEGDPIYRGKAPIAVIYTDHGSACSTSITALEAEIGARLFPHPIDGGPLPLDDRGQEIPPAGYAAIAWGIEDTLWCVSAELVGDIEYSIHAPGESPLSAFDRL